MAQDRKGHELAVGDIVVVQAEVLGIREDGSVQLEAFGEVGAGVGVAKARVAIPASCTERLQDLLEGIGRDYEDRLQKQADGYEKRLADVHKQAGRTSRKKKAHAK
jgi:hypothetical protein